MHISILLPAHNADATIGEAIESTLQQTYGSFELLLIDDGSTDRTRELMESYALLDRRIRVISSQDNRGMGASLNHAISLARYDWLTRMDADDVMMPNRIEKQVGFVTKQPGVAVASCLVHYMDEQGKVIGRNSNDIRTRKDFERYVRNNELIGFHHPGVIMRKNVILSVGGYRPQFWPADDIDLWNRVAEHGHLILVQQEYLLKYRIHLSSISVWGVRLGRMKVGWVKECMLARRRGEREPAWEEFLTRRRYQPIFRRINRERKELAKVLYKKAVLCFSRRYYFAMFPYLTIATLLQPGYILGQVIHKRLLLHDAS